MFAALLRLFWNYSVSGAENLPRRGPAIIVANHSSYLDAPFLYAVAPKKPRFMVWEEHYHLPVLGWLYRLLDAIPVDIWNETPTPISHKAYRTALAHLRSGGILAVFPEGGRTPDGKFLKWRSGAARLALTTGAPIVPVTLNGFYAAWPFHRSRPRRARLEIIVHPPVKAEAPAGVPRRKAAFNLTRRVRDIVASAYRLPLAEHLPPPEWSNPYLRSPITREALEDDQPQYASYQGDSAGGPESSMGRFSLDAHGRIS